MTTEDRRTSVLRKVRALLDQAASTNFDAERDTFIAKADQMMTAYTIESWELEMAKPAGQREKPELREYEYGSTGDSRIDDILSSIFYRLAEHCRVRVGWYGWRKSKIVGYRSDLEWLDLLFTNIRLHLASNLVPKPSPDLTYGENLALLKEAGYNWFKCYELLVPLYPDKFKLGERHDPGPEPADESVWLAWSNRKREWENSHNIVLPNGRRFALEAPRAIRVRFTGEYTKFCRESGRERVYTGPEVWRRNFAEGYGYRLQDRIRELDSSSQNTGKELVLANREEDLLEFLFEMFPDLRPHPGDCDCDNCHWRKCSTPGCSRPICRDRNKPVRYRSVAEKKVDFAARARGRSVAETADLSGGRGHVGSRRAIEG